jgi:hypothetical protein
MMELLDVHGDAISPLVLLFLFDFLHSDERQRRMWGGVWVAEKYNVDPFPWSMKNCSHYSAFEQKVGINTCARQPCCSECDA